MKKKILELRNKTRAELENVAKKSREEIAKLSLEINIKPPKDSNLIIKKKKELAVILTILGEKEELEKLNQAKLG